METRCSLFVSLRVNAGIVEFGLVGDQALSRRVPLFRKPTLDARITYLEEQAEQERDKAVAFCSTIQDARLYLIFRLRFVRCLTWAEVADLLGDYYTEEGVCRMAYNYLAKTEKEKPTAQSA